MRRILIAIAAIGCLAALVAQTVQSRPEPTKPAQPAADHSADEAVIRANVGRFMKAYNAHDAKAVAALFTPDGQIEDKEGDIADGRVAIEREFARLFADSPHKRIEVFVESIRFIGAELAVETGTTKETAAPNEPPEYDRYTVLHVKRNGKWQMALARDEEGPADTAHERLLPLAWLVGDWVDDGGSTVVASSCRWSEDGNFLLQDFKLRVNGRRRDERDATDRLGPGCQVRPLLGLRYGGRLRPKRLGTRRRRVAHQGHRRPPGRDDRLGDELSGAGRRRRLCLAVDGSRHCRRGAGADRGESRSQAAATQAIRP